MQLLLALAPVLHPTASKPPALGAADFSRTLRSLRRLLSHLGREYLVPSPEPKSNPGNLLGSILP